MERLALQRGAWRCPIQSPFEQDVWARSSGSWVASLPLYRPVRNWRYHSIRTGASLLGCIRLGKPRPRSTRIAKELPNNAMQLTKLRAAPVLQAEVPPCAPAGEMDGGTASQLIRSVGPT